MSADINANNDPGVQPGNHVPKQILSGLRAFIKRLFVRIPMRQLHEEIQLRNLLRPTLNWIQLTGIGLGSIIGAGIIILSGQAAARYAGPSVIISFIITGIVAFLSALSFSELSAMMPLSGAAYTYTYAALGEYAAWFIGWNYALLYLLAACTVTVNWSRYVAEFIDIVSDYNATALLVKAPVAWNEQTQHFEVTGGAINLPAIALSLAITAVLIIGIRQTAIVNLVLVAIKITILLIFIFATCKYVDRKNYTPFIPPNQGSFSKFGVSGTVRACTYVFFAYVGFETVATVAEEAKLRTRPVPYATLAALLISFVIFIGICTVMVGLVPYYSLDSNSPLAEALKATPYGLWLKILMNLGAIAALASVALTMLLAQTRIFFAMAHDGLLPPFFAKIHRKTETPWISTIISGVFCAVISGICPVDLVGETTSISALITYLFVHIEVIVMRYRHRDMQRPFRVPFGPWLIPVLGSILCILLMTGIEKETAYRFLVWTAIGQVFYFSYGFWHSNRRIRQRAPSLRSALELVATVEGVAATYPDPKNEPQVAFNNEAMEDDTFQKF